MFLYSHSNPSIEAHLHSPLLNIECCTKNKFHQMFYFMMVDSDKIHETRCRFLNFRRPPFRPLVPPSLMND